MLKLVKKTLIHLFWPTSKDSVKRTRGITQILILIQGCHSNAQTDGFFRPQLNTSPHQPLFHRRNFPRELKKTGGGPLDSPTENPSTPFIEGGSQGCVQRTPPRASLLFQWMLTYHSDPETLYSNIGKDRWRSNWAQTFR